MAGGRWRNSGARPGQAPTRSSTGRAHRARRRLNETCHARGKPPASRRPRPPSAARHRACQTITGEWPPSLWRARGDRGQVSSGISAVVSISRRARSSIRLATSTRARAGNCRPIMSRQHAPISERRADISACRRRTRSFARYVPGRRRLRRGRPGCCARLGRAGRRSRRFPTVRPASNQSARRQIPSARAPIACFRWQRRSKERRPGVQGLPCTLLPSQH